MATTTTTMSTTTTTTIEPTTTTLREKHDRNANEIASIVRKPDGVATLRKIGFDPNALDPRSGNYGETYLLTACREGELPAVKVFIKLGADLTQKNSDGETALMNACYNSGKDTTRAELVTFLLQIMEVLASINLVDNYGMSALYHAADNDAAVVRLLLASGADHTKCNSLGETVVEYALAYGNEEVVQLIENLSP